MNGAIGPGIDARSGVTASNANGELSMESNQPNANKRHYPPARSLGAILIGAGRLNHQETGRILQLQKEEGLRFGEAARQLGVVDGEDIAFALSQQFEYTCLQPGDDAVSQDVLAAFGSQHPLVEALRDLRSRLMLLWLNKKSSRKCIALVSVRRGDGKSFIAANLAVLFCQLGQRTLLIDADLIHPCQHRLFKLDNRVGLSSVLSGLAGMEVAEPIPQLGGLTVLPAGPMPPNPRELLSRPMLASLLAQARQAFDVVLVDTPSAALAADAPIIAAHAGASLLISRPDTASIDEIAALTSSLDNLLGAVVNQF